MTSDTTNFNLYENDNYVVIANPERTITETGASLTGLYDVVSKQTGFVEYFTPSLPDAKRIAANWDVALRDETHLDVYRWAEQQNQLPGGSPFVGGDDPEGGLLQ